MEQSSPVPVLDVQGQCAGKSRLAGAHAGGRWGWAGGHEGDTRTHMRITRNRSPRSVFGATGAAGAALWGDPHPRWVTTSG